jgi:hypothetical protein
MVELRFVLLGVLIIMPQLLLAVSVNKRYYFDSLGGHEFIKRNRELMPLKRYFDSLGGQEFIKRASYFDRLGNEDFIKRARDIYSDDYDNNNFNDNDDYFQIIKLLRSRVNDNDDKN